MLYLPPSSSLACFFPLLETEKQERAFTLGLAGLRRGRERERKCERLRPTHCRFMNGTDYTLSFSLRCTEMRIHTHTHTHAYAYTHAWALIPPAFYSNSTALLIGLQARYRANLGQEEKSEAKNSWEREREREREREKREKERKREREKTDKERGREKERDFLYSFC